LVTPEVSAFLHFLPTLKLFVCHHNTVATVAIDVPKFHALSPFLVVSVRRPIFVYLLHLATDAVNSLHVVLEAPVRPPACSRWFVAAGFYARLTRVILGAIALGVRIFVAWHRSLSLLIRITDPASSSSSASESPHTVGRPFR
jgi:hypothetical protein